MPGDAGLTPRMREDICTSGEEHQPWLLSPPVHVSKKERVSRSTFQRRIWAVPYFSNNPA